MEKIEFRKVKELVPMSEYGMRAVSSGFPEWYYRTQPKRDVVQFRAMTNGKWSDWRNGPVLQEN